MADTLIYGNIARFPYDRNDRNDRNSGFHMIATIAAMIIGALIIGTMR